MITYKVKERLIKFGKHKGKTMYFASPIEQDKITTEQVEERIVNRTALSRADIRAAITVLAEIVQEELQAGRSVDLADLGTIKVVSNGKYKEAEKDVTEDSLKTPHVRFFPKKSMVERAKKVQRRVLSKQEAKKTEEDKKKPTPEAENNP